MFFVPFGQIPPFIFECSISVACLVLMVPEIIKKQLSISYTANSVVGPDNIWKKIKSVTFRNMFEVPSVVSPVFVFPLHGAPGPLVDKGGVHSHSYGGTTFKI